MNRFTRLRRYLKECHFVFTSVPNLSSMVGQTGNLASALSQFGQSTNQVKHGLVTSCDIARSLCKPVDDLAGRRGYGYGYGSYSPYYGTPSYGAPRPVVTPMPVGINFDDKSALLAATKQPVENLIAEASAIADGT